MQYAISDVGGANAPQDMQPVAYRQYAAPLVVGEVLWSGQMPAFPVWSANLQAPAPSTPGPGQPYPYPSLTPAQLAVWQALKTAATTAPAASFANLAAAEAAVIALQATVQHLAQAIVFAFPLLADDMFG